MKRQVLIIAAVIISMTLNACTINLDGETFGGKIIKGDGNIVTRNFDVKSFDDLAVFLPFTTHYDVNFTIADTYSCTVRMDENLFEYLEVKVKDGELQLGNLQKQMKERLSPTECVIEVTAPGLDEINMAGSGNVNILSPLNANKMEFFVAGSGNIVFKGPAHISDVELGIAGSGDIHMPALISEDLELNIAGSGNAKIESGSVTEAEIDIAGSGNCNLACEIGKLDANIAGSGDITARVIGQLEYSIIGSGDIGYYGNPELKGDKLGRGKVTCLGD